MPTQQLHHTPYDEDAEQAVLAALMSTSNQEDLATIFSLLKPNDFWFETHRWVYEAAQEQWAAGRACDHLVVGSALSQRNGQQQSQLEECGGRMWLLQLIQGLPSPVGCTYWANVVKQCAHRRQVIQEATNLISMAQRQQVSLDALRDHAIDRLCGIGQSAAEQGAGGPIRRLLSEGDYDYLLNRVLSPAGSQGLTTGIPSLDRRINGLEAETTYSISAPSSLGKSFLMAYMAWKGAAAGAKVVYFSTEMSKEQMLVRFQHMIAGIDPLRVKRRSPQEWSDDEQARLIEAIGIFNDLPISLYARFKPNVAYLRSVLRREAASGRIGLIVVDGMHSMSVGEQRRDIELGELASDFNVFAQEYHCPLVFVAHQNRAMDGGDMLNKLRDSANIGDRAHTAIFLKPMNDDWSKELTADGARLRADIPGWMNVNLNLAKVRTGNTGNVRTRFNLNTGGRWSEVTVD